jgi:uncharacterized protein (TIGR03084 family)
MVSIDELRDDLEQEQLALDALVAPLTAAAWRQATPSPGWTVADQIGHLAFFDHAGAVAIADPAAFTPFLHGMLADMQAAASGQDVTLAPFRAMQPAALLDAWRGARHELLGAAATLTGAERLSWFGPPMGALSFLTARLMEVWAHGQDIVDALALHRASTDRLRHVAQLGVITRGWSYRNRGLESPPEPVAIELSAPSGAVWRFGEPGAADQISGTAEDFCLVVTQRRHVDDTALVTTGAAARDWMERAQAFAGRPSIRPPH